MRMKLYELFNLIAKTKVKDLPKYIIYNGEIFEKSNYLIDRILYKDETGRNITSFFTLNSLKDEIIVCNKIEFKY